MRKVKTGRFIITSAQKVQSDLVDTVDHRVSGKWLNRKLFFLKNILNIFFKYSVILLLDL